MYENEDIYPEMVEITEKKRKLTARQEQVLNYIRECQEEQGFPPTVRQIASHLNIVSLNAVRRHLQALEKKGHVNVEKGISRGIQLLETVQHETSNSIPLVGRIAAGPLSMAEEEVEGKIIMDPELWGNPEDLFLLTVKGNSMEPDIQEGDMVVVRRQPYANPFDIIVALVDDEATVKQLLINKGKYFLHPINRAYDDMPTGEGFRINGVVIGLIRKYR